MNTKTAGISVSPFRIHGFTVGFVATAVCPPSCTARSCHWRCETRRRRLQTTLTAVSVRGKPALHRSPRPITHRDSVTRRR